MNIEKFQNQLIAFDYDNEMVNATDILKAFKGKEIGGFLRNQKTKNFVKAFESDMQNRISSDFQAIKIVKGNYKGIKQGTWMHRIVAYKFAAWLSPEFEVFIYKIFDNHLPRKITYPTATT